MVNISINTTQNVNINFVAASVGERLLAYLIAWIIKIAYVIVVYQLMLRSHSPKTSIHGVQIRSFKCFKCPTYQKKCYNHGPQIFPITQLFNISNIVYL